MMDEIEPPPPTINHWPTAVIDSILDAIAEGKSLESVLASRPEAPGKTTWFRWVAADVEFSRRYTSAVAAGVTKRVYRTR